MLDAARRRFMHHQQAVRESELKRLDREVQKRVVQREEETKHVLEDIETRALELERQKVLLEQELAKCQEEVSTGMSYVLGVNNGTFWTMPQWHILSLTYHYWHKGYSALCITITYL